MEEYYQEEITQKKEKLLREITSLTEKDCCLAFSGGVDSSLLLFFAVQEAKRQGTKVIAVTFQTRLHPPCDLAIAERVAKEMGAQHVILYVDELEQEEIRQNPKNRCYLCKRHLFEKLREFARTKGIDTILDGTNEDDLHVYRPGLQALKECGVISPLADCQITKQEVKELAAEVKLSVASRPSTPCMATRLPYGTRIDYEFLNRISAGEEWLHTILGKEGNIRLRVHGDLIRLEVDPENLPKVLSVREKIVSYLKKLGFSYVTLDLQGFRSGSMDEWILQKEKER